MTEQTVADERENLNDYLEHFRSELERKCDGLDPVQLAERSCPPSNLSLLGLVRHMASVEQYWFRSLAGETFERMFKSPADKDLDFNGAVGEQAVVDEAFAAWQGEIEHAREVAAAAELTDTFYRDRDDAWVSLREILVHMIEEYARHCGHADLIRERIDGATG